MVPHLKDGDHYVPNNNRPISFLPMQSKVAQRIAWGQFNNHLTQNRFTGQQSGNRKHQSTRTLSLHIFSAVDKKQITAMLLIDSQCHSIQNLGTHNKAFKWFESFLRNRQQVTRVATWLSEPLTITHGYFRAQFSAQRFSGCAWMIYPKLSSLFRCRSAPGLVTSNLTLMTLR